MWPEKIDKFTPLVPLLYLSVTGAIAALLYWAKVPNEITAMIVGAGLTRVKIPSKQ